MKTVLKRNAKSLSDPPSPCLENTPNKVRLLSREQVRSAEPAPRACVAADIVDTRAPVMANNWGSAEEQDKSCITCTPVSMSTLVNGLPCMQAGQADPLLIVTTFVELR